MKTIFNRLFSEAKKEKEFLTLGATGNALEKMPIFFTQMFKKGKKEKIKFKNLWNYDAKKIKEFKTFLSSEDRKLPKNFKTATQVFISGKFSAILIWSHLPLAILIEDKEISKGFKQYFNFMWEVAK